MFASAQIPSSGLVAFYPFNKNTEDIGPNQYNAIASTNVTYVADRNGNTLSSGYFDGFTSEMLLNPGENTLLKPQDAFTVSLWFKISENITNPYPTLIQFRNDNNDFYYYNIGFVFIGDLSTYRYYGASNSNNLPLYSEALLINAGIAPNTWVNTMLVYTGSALELYVNNSLLATSPMSNFTYDNALDVIAIGSNYGAGYHYGEIDDVAIYDRALDPAERTQLVSDTTSTIEVIEEPNNVAEEGKNVNIRLYPNPANNVINITTTDATVNMVSLYSIEGKELSSQNFSKLTTIDVEGLKAGVYIVKITNSNGRVAVKRFIKN